MDILPSQSHERASQSNRSLRNFPKEVQKQD